MILSGDWGLLHKKRKDGISAIEREKNVASASIFGIIVNKFSQW